MHHLIKMCFHLGLITLFLVVGAINGGNAQSIPERVEKMKSYRSEGAYAEYLDLAIQLDSVVIEHPYFNLSILEAALLTNRDSIACAQLNRRIQYNADLSTLPDTTLRSVGSLPCFNPIKEQAEKHLIQKIASELAFELSDSTIHPESIVFDSKTETYFISSVRHRAVYSYQRGVLKPFIPSADQGIGAVLGLAIDSENRILYITSAHIPEMENYDTRNAFRNTLLKYHLDSGILIERNDVFDSTNPRLLGEIKVASDGTAFITDSYEPVVLKWNNDNTLEEFIRIPKARSLQGLAFDESTGMLYIADYSTGVYVYDLYTGQFVQSFHRANDISLKGIDGLYYFDQTLIGIQNGTVPHRIIQLDVSNPQSVSLNILENALDYGGEPTNGVIVNGSLLYIANSPWPFYEENQPNYAKFKKSIFRRLKF